MRKGIFDGSVRGCVVVLEREVLAQELVDWRCPLEAWIVVLILDEQGNSCCCEGFSRAPSVIERIRGSWCIWKVREPVALLPLLVRAAPCWA